ncbi:MAG: TerB family tellurite resistance protein [Muribaculaceae bacterium]|nr:TerB family tellurite resistance protein [Muribaculaceae bacterium]
MKLTGLQISAAVKAGVAIMEADGETKQEELQFISSEIANFNVSQEQAESIIARASTMSSSEMFSVLSSMTDDEKKYVFGFLAQLVVVDGEIAMSEIRTLKTLSTLSGMPNLDVSKSIDYWKNH